MSLQISSASHAISSNQRALLAFGNYKQAASPHKLDPITEQIVKTQEAALEVMKLIEKGVASKFWEEQKRIPASTWLGNFVDRIFGWGAYLADTGLRLKKKGIF